MMNLDGNDLLIGWLGTFHIERNNTKKKTEYFIR